MEKNTEEGAIEPEDNFSSDPEIQIKSKKRKPQIEEEEEDTYEVTEKSTKQRKVTQQDDLIPVLTATASLLNGLVALLSQHKSSSSSTSATYGRIESF